MGGQWVVSETIKACLFICLVPESRSFATPKFDWSLWRLSASVCDIYMAYRNSSRLDHRHLSLLQYKLTLLKSNRAGVKAYIYSWMTKSCTFFASFLINSSVSQLNFELQYNLMNLLPSSCVQKTHLLNVIWLNLVNKIKFSNTKTIKRQVGDFQFPCRKSYCVCVCWLIIIKFLKFLGSCSLK